MTKEYVIAYFSSSMPDTVSKSAGMSRTISPPPGFFTTTTVGDGGHEPKETDNN